MVLGAVLEPVRREFSLSDTQLGAMVTLFTVVYAVAGLPAGRMADTRGRRGLLAAGIAVWAGLTGMAGLATSYAMLLGTRLGVGIGEAVCTPAATSWIGDAVAPARRSRAMAWFMMAVPVGGLLSFSIGGPAAQAYGWRIAMALAAAPALLLIPAVLWLREPARVGRAAGTVVGAQRSAGDRLAGEAGDEEGAEWRRHRLHQHVEVLAIGLVAEIVVVGGVALVEVGIEGGDERTGDGAVERLLPDRQIVGPQPAETGIRVRWRAGCVVASRSPRRWCAPAAVMRTSA
jgi:MFS family permease